MDNLEQSFKRDELAALKLRSLYERRGFRRVSVNKFEEYDLYIENRSFLQAEQVITFMDMDGKLLALKPDVTLSVVKNIPAGPLPAFQKLYYTDEVFRVSRENREYKALSQIGVELVGPADVFASIEVVDLALLSLAAIGDNYLLDLSHLGFVSGLLGYAGLGHTAERKILSAIHAKSLHAARAALDEAGAEEDVKNRILAMAGLHGELSAALPGARALVVNDETGAAYDELCAVASALDYNGFAGRLNLDFSVVNDLDYYNGLIFHGYVEGLPNGVLTGGRYDGLMRRMGKQSGAIGFAVQLGQLNTYLKSGRHYDFDIAITYDGDSDWAALLRIVKELTARGTSVRLERSDADLSAADFTFRRHCRFQNSELAEEGGEGDA